MRTRLLYVITLAAAANAIAADAVRKPVQLSDIMAWNRIQSPIVSSDRKWFAYKLAPNEGNSEVLLRNLGDGKEQRFPIGELAAGGGGGADLVFSGDSKWLAMSEYPSVKEAQQLKKNHKPLQNKLLLVELATGKKTEFEGIRRFSFSGERASALAMHRYPATPAAPAAPPAPPAAGAAPKPDDRPQGADLILYDLASASELNFGNVSDFAFDKHGDWLAWLVDAQDKLGNGISARNMSTGAVIPLDSAKAAYKGLAWSEKGEALATLRGVEDKAWTDKLYAVVALKGFTSTAPPQKFVYDPAKDTAFPAGMAVSANRNAAWMADLSAVTFGIHENKRKEEKPKDDKADAAVPDDRPSLMIWHWKDPRLQSMQQVQETADKNFSYLCAWLPDTQKFVRLADPEVRQVTLSPYQKYGVGVDVRAYELTANLSGDRRQDIYQVNPHTGERKLAIKNARYFEGASPDGSHLLYYNDGAFFSYDMTTGQSHNLTEQIASVFYDTEDDHNVVKPPTRTLGWTKDGDYVLLTDNWDIWKVPSNGGPAVNLTGNGKKDKVRYGPFFRLDPEERGVNFTKPVYVRAFGELTKKGGIGLIDPGQNGVRMLHFDDAQYTTLLKAKNAETYLYTRETNQDFPNFYAAAKTLDSSAKITDANPQQKDFLWTPGVKMVEYTGPQGQKLQGDLFLPANYEAGKKYPAVIYIYEKLTQSTNAYPAPGFNGFSAGAYTSNGYAVLTPDIAYKVNDPGVSSVACILAALKAAIATGVVDPARVALHGHSWGGYQTAFAVTQTNAFRAAIAGAPLTDMVSMYSSIYWNTGSANQPIFEASQGRFTGGYWGGNNMEAYIRNSPVYHAQNVTTPLIILSNDKDGAVDHTQGIEYYNTLRRLGKTVVMLEYKGENHGLVKPENKKDYTARMKEFFDHYLMDKPAPKWLTEGVPLIQMSDELEQREKQSAKPVEAAAAATGNQK